MQTELQFSVIYLAQEKNDVNNFDFFIRMIPTEDKNTVSLVSIPRYSLDGKMVKHIKFSVSTDKELYAYDILSIIAELKELETIVCDIQMSAAEAEARLKQLMLTRMEQFRRE